MRAFILITFVVLALLPFAVPTNFPSHGQPVVIAQGLTTSEIAKTLETQGVIRSHFAFSMLSTVLGKSKNLVAGRYLFERPIPAWSVLMRIAKGDFGTHVRKITIPEGSTNKQIGILTISVISNEGQGFLFPDTYFFDQFMTGNEVRAKMLENFHNKVGTVATDTVTLASIIEGEVKLDVDRRLVAGILIKRIKLGMPLQVDIATSTYSHKGLPSKPVNNPGLEAITAALNPTASPYIYYISDRDGIIRYARTFEEHKANRDRYGI